METLTAPPVLRADCTPPLHPCHAAHNRVFREGGALLVVHRHPAHANLRLFIARPLELTRYAQVRLLSAFETCGRVGLLDVGAKAHVGRSEATFTAIPHRAVEVLAKSILGAVEFRSVV